MLCSFAAQTTPQDNHSEDALTALMDPARWIDSPTSGTWFLAQLHWGSSNKPPTLTYGNSLSSFDLWCRNVLNTLRTNGPMTHSDFLTTAERLLHQNERPPLPPHQDSLIFLPNFLYTRQLICKRPAVFLNSTTEKQHLVANAIDLRCHVQHGGQKFFDALADRYGVRNVCWSYKFLANINFGGGGGGEGAPLNLRDLFAPKVSAF